MQPRMRSAQGPSRETVTHPYSDSESVQSEWMYFAHLFSILSEVENVFQNINFVPLPEDYIHIII